MRQMAQLEGTEQMGGEETQGAAGTNAGAMGIYDPSYNYGGYDMWSGVGKGLQQFGAGIAGGGYTPSFGAAPQLPEANIGGEDTTLPRINNEDDVLDVIRRLIGGLGGYQTSGFKVL